MNLTRRGFLIKSAIGLLAAPALVRMSSIMPVKAWTESGHGFVTLVPWQDPSAWGSGSFGLAQLKQEGMPISFDSCVDPLRWQGGERSTAPAAEQIWVGDMVSMFGGRAYRAHPLERITHVAITSSNLRD